MMNNSDWQKYIEDPRSVCKYGVKCYQKNPEHHANYKHPPISLKVNRGNRNKHRHSPYKRDTPSPRARQDITDPEISKDSGQSSNKNNIISNHGDTEPSFSRHREERDLADLDTKTDNGQPTNKNYESNNHSDTFSKYPKQTTLEKCSGKSIDTSENITYYDSSKHEVLKELFLVDMPLDFYKFYECLNHDNTIEQLLSNVNLELIGPYDLLLGKLPIIDDKELYLIHWRFFYDPPEFQSVLKRKGNSEFHIGYFRDDPKEKPVFVASNDSRKDYHIKPMAANIFAAVYIHLQSEKKSSPFNAIACQKLMEKVKRYAEENNFPLEEYNMKKRQATIVTKSFHGAGIVVPYNKKTQLGYRHLVENDATIKKLFTRLEAAKTQSEKDNILSELQPVITYASIAVDECDFGTGIEVGVALFCSGLKELEPSALSSLSAAYTLLNREPFAKIMQAHLKFRRKGPNMSMLNISDN